MRTLLMLVLLIDLATLVGCAGVTKTPSEVAHTTRQTLDLDLRQITDDWNMIWMSDRPYRLTKWYTR